LSHASLAYLDGDPPLPQADRHGHGLAVFAEAVPLLAAQAPRLRDALAAALAVYDWQAEIALGCTGMAITSVLHGFNDWVASPAGFFFVLVNVVSRLLFLGYARVGASPDALKVKEEEETS
jgi:hypothetical protein